MMPISALRVRILSSSSIEMALAVVLTVVI
jgi:hypothetical protein